MAHILAGWAKEFRVLKVWKGLDRCLTCQIRWMSMYGCVCVFCGYPSEALKKVGFHSVMPGKLIFHNEIKYWVQRLFYKTHSPLLQIHLCKRKWPCLIKTWVYLPYGRLAAGYCRMETAEHYKCLFGKRTKAKLKYGTQHVPNQQALQDNYCDWVRRTFWYTTTSVVKWTRRYGDYSIRGIIPKKR